jgi:methyl-accepting chemotaxis protein
MDMAESISLIGAKVARVKRLLEEATGATRDVVTEVDSIGRAIDDVTASLGAIRDQIAQAVDHVANLLKTPNLSDDSRSAIEDLGGLCEAMRFAVDNIATDLSAELQEHATKVGDSPR